MFFLREGSKKAKDIVQLVDIKSVEKFEQKTIFTGPTQDLRIISKGKMEIIFLGERRGQGRKRALS